MQEPYSLRKPIIENKKSKRRELGKLATNKRSFRTLCKFTAWNKFHLIGRAGVYVTNRRVNHSPPRLPLNFSLNSWSPRSKQLQSFPNYSINDGTLPKFGGERGLAVNSKRDGRKGLACHDSPPWLDKSDTRNYAIPVCAVCAGDSKDGLPRGHRAKIVRPGLWPKIKGRSGTTEPSPPLLFPCFCFIRARSTLVYSLPREKFFVGTIARVSVHL